MKPLNYDNSPCSPISSNCVIWQGPDLDCIKLCKGDTISDIVAKLATELCTIMEVLNISNYNLSCFNLVACAPNDFIQFQQFLIEQICNLNNVVNTIAPIDTATPNDSENSQLRSRAAETTSDTLVSVAPCFVVDERTVMSITEYSTESGNQICNIINQINVINNTINQFEIRINNIENTPAVTFTLPTISVGCTLQSSPFIGIGTGALPIDIILNKLIDDPQFGYCALRSATGLPVDILSSVLSQNILDSDLSLVYGTPFNVAYAPNWVSNSSINKVSDSIFNIWSVLYDLYDHALNSQVLVSNTSTVNLKETLFSGGKTISAKITDTGWIDLDGFTYYAGVAKPQCRRIGNQINFKGTVYIPLENPSIPGAVVTLTSTSTYNAIAGCATWNGTGGCLINSNGSISFNNGGSVIPSTITTGNLDDTYCSTWNIALIPIDVDATHGTSLTSAIKVSITSTKGLVVQVIHDVEITATRPTGVLGNSPLRFITSNVRAGEFLPDYLGAATDIHNGPSSAGFNLFSDTYSYQWPFACDAGNENQIGGFSFNLDGLIGYLDVCNNETGLSIVCP